MRSRGLATILSLALVFPVAHAGAADGSRPEGPRIRVIGVLAGTALGAGVGAATGGCPPSSPGGGLPVFGVNLDNLCLMDTGESAAAAGILGAVAGALVGLAVSHGEKWETTTPDRLHVAIAPTRGGAVFRVSFGF